MRATISVVRSGAAPDMNELAVNSVQQIRKNRVRPSIPTSQPVAGMTTALAARYEVITHETSSSPAESDTRKCGRTTLVTLVSRICMKATTMTVKVMAHFRAEEIGGGSSAESVAPVPAGTPAGSVALLLLGVTALAPRRWFARRRAERRRAAGGGHPRPLSPPGESLRPFHS